MNGYRLFGGVYMGLTTGIHVFLPYEARGKASESQTGRRLILIIIYYYYSCYYYYYFCYFYCLTHGAQNGSFLDADLCFLFLQSPSKKSIFEASCLKTSETLGGAANPQEKVVLLLLTSEVQRMILTLKP